MKKEKEENNILGPTGIKARDITLEWINKIKNIYYENEEAKIYGIRMKTIEGDHLWKELKKISNHIGMRRGDLVTILLEHSIQDFKIVIPLSNKMGYDPLPFYNDTRNQLRTAYKSIDPKKINESSRIQHRVVDDISKSVKIRVE